MCMLWSGLLKRPKDAPNSSQDIPDDIMSVHIAGPEKAVVASTRQRPAVVSVVEHVRLGLRSREGRPYRAKGPGV
jgi:hypothetical protein